MNELINQVNWPDVIAGGVVGFFAAILVAALFEWVRKPNLMFVIDLQKGEGERKINRTNYKWKFLNVIIHNKKRPFYRSWLWGNVGAENTRAWIYFRNFKTNELIVKVSARWASTKQPINNFGLDINEILVASRESIPVDEDASLAVAIKTNKSDKIFAFNNESYFFYPTYNPPYNTLWSKKEFEIGNMKKYKVSIRALAQGHNYWAHFILMNPNSSYNSIKLQKWEVMKIDY